MDYEDMSDKQLNLKAAEFMPFLVASKQDSRKSSVFVHDIVNQFEFDPCGSYEDLCDLLEQMHVYISIQGCALCYISGEYITVMSSNRSRSAVICFLMAKDFEINNKNSESNKDK